MASSSEMVTWLTQAGATRIDASGDEITCTCPFHHKRDPSRGKTFQMNVKTGVWLCFSTRCGLAGNLISFLIKALGWRAQHAIRASERLGMVSLDDPSLGVMPDYENRHTSDVTIAREGISEGFVGLYNFCPDYMIERGFKKEVLKTWEVGYDFGTERVTFAVRDIEGRLLGFTKRSTRNVEPVYMHMGFKRASVLYGGHRAGKHVVVAEGPADVLALYQMGIQRRGLSPIGTMGARVSRHQIEALADFDTVVLSYDNDYPGRVATLYVGDSLIPKLPRGRVLIARRFRDIKDPGQFLEKPELFKDYLRFEDYFSVRREIAQQVAEEEKKTNGNRKRNAADQDGRGRVQGKFQRKLSSIQSQGRGVGNRSVSWR